MSSKDPMVGDKLLSSLRVVDLKEELEKRSLSKSGTKKDLADRLRNYIVQHEQKEPVVAAPPVLDEDELPSISMQEKQLLAEKNPFLRDYFASQAELFHSQKVAKKLLLEEARRESETSAPSADEGGESSAAEDKDLNSSTEELSSGKVKQLAKKFENNSAKETPPISKEQVPSTPPPALRASPVRKSETPTPPQVVQPFKTTRQRQLENLAKKAESSKIVEASKPSPEKSVDMVEKVVAQKPIDASPKAESPASSSSSSRSRSVSRSRSNSPESDHRERNTEKPYTEDAKPEPEEEQHSPPSDDNEVNERQLPLGSNGNVKKLAEKFENKIDDSVKTPSPIKKVIEKTVETNEAEMETVATVEEEDKTESVASRSRSTSRSRSPSLEKEPAVEQHDEQPKEDEDSHQKNGETSVVDAITAVANEENADIECTKIDSSTKSLENKIDTKPEQKVTARNDMVLSAPIEDEEMLDYGEEEKLQSEPPKFYWTRRVLRIKNRHISKPQENKWKREIDIKAAENINSELMSEWFPNVRLSPAVEFKEDKPDKSPPETQDEQDVRFTRTFSIESEEGAVTSMKMENITITRRVSLVPMISTQNDNDVDKDLSPARNPPSEIILVSNLTRPFTLPQLRELLQRTGTLEDLWVDKIKSKCIAKYEKQEDAFETRAALHGVNWPPSNPKALQVDYTTEETLVEYKARDAGEIKPAVIEKPVTAENLPVREWDMGKRQIPSPKRRRSKSTSRDRKRSRRSESPLNRRRHSRSPQNGRRSRGQAKDNEPLGKALDELFRKTVAIPSIYWLPLTPAQIAEKEELRRKRMIERERRLAEMNKIRPR
ncbi:apoptotic chromatin condensation inducer in the nucleus isoform X2 [Folsomia candida]|uniref:apoptotic chromatin condensation inducer in the nucleus isoform X2 n=1 Tax=Folsomia candida TaxID=158441 RepID=UPI000B8FC477|nr:apoptotic chromatin condensation inducer in the nucleus isoform X2 [Folsomia candida]